MAFEANSTVARSASLSYAATGMPPLFLTTVRGFFFVKVAALFSIARHLTSPDTIRSSHLDPRPKYEAGCDNERVVIIDALIQVGIPR